MSWTKMWSCMHPAPPPRGDPAAAFWPTPLARARENPAASGPQGQGPGPPHSGRPGFWGGPGVGGEEDGLDGWAGRGGRGVWRLLPLVVGFAAGFGLVPVASVHRFGFHSFSFSPATDLVRPTG